MSASDDTPAAKPRRFLFERFVIYVLPLIVVAGIVVLSASAAAGYHTSWRLIVFFLNLFDTSSPPVDPITSVETGVSVYKLNGAFRTLSHIALYAVVTGAAIRAVQFGHPRLKRLSLFVAAILGLLFIAGDEAVRMHSFGRHAKPRDWWLNLSGIAIVLVSTVLVYALRGWERRVNSHTQPDKIL